MKKRVMCGLLVLGFVSLCAWPAQAARRGSSEREEGEPATVIYRQMFDEDGMLDNFSAAGGGLVTWEGNNAGAYASPGAMRIAGDSQWPSAEKYMKWEDRDTTITFMYKSEGVKSAYFQGSAQKSGGNVHAYFPTTGGGWQFARIKASSMIPFAGGGAGADDIFRNILFVLETQDKTVDEPYLLIDRIVIFSGKDGKRPTQPPSEVTAEWDEEAGAVCLNWTAGVDDVGMGYYSVYRATTEKVPVKSETRLAKVYDNYYEDKTAEPGMTYYYLVVGVDLGGFAIEAEQAVACTRGGAAAAASVPAVGETDGEEVEDGEEDF